MKTRRPMNHLADLAQAILDELPPDHADYPGGSSGPPVHNEALVATIRTQLEELREIAAGYDARRYRLDAVGKKRQTKLKGTSDNA